jgi:ferredoxin
MMRLIIDNDKCIGCGLCEEALPEIIEVGRFTAKLTTDRVPDNLIAAAIAVIEDCPTEAISAVT